MIRHDIQTKPVLDNILGYILWKQSIITFANSLQLCFIQSFE